MDRPDCSLTASEREGRARELQRTLGPRVREIQEADSRLGLRFEPNAENRADLEDFVAFERGCCQGLRFEIEERGDALWLHIEGPGSVVSLSWRKLRSPRGSSSCP